MKLAADYDIFMEEVFIDHVIIIMWNDDEIMFQSMQINSIRYKFVTKVAHLLMVMRTMLVREAATLP